MVNVAIVGLGYWGPNLVRNMAKNKEVTVEERLRALYDLQLIDIKRYTEYGVHAGTLNNEIKERLNAYIHIERNVPFISSIEYVADLLDNSMSFQDEQAAIRWKSLDEIISEGVTWY